MVNRRLANVSDVLRSARNIVKNSVNPFSANVNDITFMPLSYHIIAQKAKKREQFKQVTGIVKEITTK
jgi:hypothetical protein